MIEGVVELLEKQNKPRINLMSDDVEQLKSDVKLILDRVTDMRLSAATLDERINNMNTAIKRAHNRLDQIDTDIRDIKATQYKNSWIPLIATAALTAMAGAWVQSFFGG